MKLRWRIGLVLTYPFARLVLRLRVKGRNNLLSGPQILAANHVSNFDPLIVGMAAAREIHFLAKEELFKASRWFAWLIRTWNAWPVRRGGADSAALKQCSWLLKRGQTIVLFPEGTRSRTGELQQFQPGIGFLALSNHVPVIPVYLAGVDRSNVSYWVDRDFVRRGFRHKPAQPTSIHVSFGTPVLPDRFSRDRTGYDQLTQAVAASIRLMAEKSS
ncbi:MAG: lysophospholipid acyltransferase family protein [candidate division WOR-3 bacterium]